MTTATLTDAATVTLAFPLAAAEGLRHAIALAIPQRPTNERDMLASIYGALVNPQPAPMRAAGAPVDVLAVMDAAIEAARSRLRDAQTEGTAAASAFRSSQLDGVLQARAAIAELIACAQRSAEILERVDDPAACGNAQRLRTALARAGSAGGAP